MEGEFEELLQSIQLPPEVLEFVETALLGLWEERLADFQGVVAGQQRTPAGEPDRGRGQQVEDV